MTEGPNWYNEFEIVSIQELGGTPASELLVSLYAWDSEYDQIRPIRFWLTKNQQHWKVSDWEEVDIGISEATEYAVIYETEANSRQLKNYYSFWEQYANALTARSEYQYDRSTKLLPLNVMPEIKPACLLLAARLLSDNGEYQAVIDFVATHQGAASPPGIPLLLATCHHKLGQHDEALAEVDRHLAMLDFSPAGLGLKTEILFALDRPELAIAELKSNINSFPDDPTLALRLGSVITEDSCDEILDCVKSLPQPQDRLQTLFDQLYGVSEYRVAKKIAREMQHSSDSARLETEADLAVMISDVPTASEKLLAAAKQSESNEEKKRLTERYVVQLDRLGRAIELVENAPLPQAAMNYLFELWQDSNTETSNEEMLVVAEAYHQKFPKSVAAKLYVGVIQATLTQNLAAEKTLRETLQHQDLTDEQKTLALNNLRSVLIDLDDVEAAINVDDLSAETWGKVASFLNRTEFEKHQKLLAEYRDRVAEDPSLKAENSIQVSRSLLLWRRGRRVDAAASLFNSGHLNSEEQTYYGGWGLLERFLQRLNSAETNSFREQIEKSGVLDSMADGHLETVIGLVSRVLLEHYKAGETETAGELIQLQAKLVGDSAKRVWALESLLLENVRNNPQSIETIKEATVADVAAVFPTVYAVESWIESVVQRLLISKKFDLAELFLKKMEQRYELSFSARASVALAKRDTNTVISMLDTLEGPSSYEFNSLMQDPLGAFVFRDAAFVDQRRQLPLINTWSDTDQIHLVYQQRPNGEEIAEKIMEEVSGLEFATIPSAPESDQKVIFQQVAFDGDASISVAVRRGRLKAYASDTNRDDEGWVVTFSFGKMMASPSLQRLHSPLLMKIVPTKNLSRVYVEESQLDIKRFPAWSKSAEAQKTYFRTRIQSDYLWFEASESDDSTPLAW